MIGNYVSKSNYQAIMGLKGSGAHGKVHKGQNIITGELVAIKEIKIWKGSIRADI